jgi:hypothetical protein
MKIKTVFTLLFFTVMASYGVIAQAQQPKKAEPNSFCPKISDIKKDTVTQKWSAQTADGTWKSYHTSFASNLTQFLGAQWNGELVGQLTCVYGAQQRFTEEGSDVIQPALPVLLVFYALTFEPKGFKWKRVQMGVHNCYSFRQKNCPFKIHIQKQVGDLYQEAESLKSKNDNQLQPVNY